MLKKKFLQKKGILTKNKCLPKKYTFSPKKNNNVFTEKFKTNQNIY